MNKSNSAEKQPAAAGMKSNQSNRLKEGPPKKVADNISSSSSFFVQHDLDEVMSKHSDPVMSEWDDDNVVVIDLTEERSLSGHDAARNGPKVDRSEAFANEERDDVSSANTLELISLDTSQSSSLSQVISIIELKDSRNKSGRRDNQNTPGDNVTPSSLSSASSKESNLDDDFHCKELDQKDSSAKSDKKALMNSRGAPYSGKMKPVSKLKAFSLDEEIDEDSRPMNVLSRLHQEIYQSSKLKNEKNNNVQKIQAEFTSPIDRSGQQLAPVKLRPWEQKNLRNEFLGGREVTYIRPRNPYVLGEDDRDTYSPVRRTTSGSHNSESATISSSAAVTPLSAESEHKFHRPVSKSLSNSRDGSSPLSIYSKRTSREHSAPEDSYRKPLERGLKPLGIYRSVLVRRPATNTDQFERDDFQFVARKTRSSDFLDRLDTSVSSRTRTRSSAGFTPSTATGSGAKMTRIEKNLFLGNMEAATDVILLESNAITHIVSVDSVPLPRKISSMLPRITFMHLQISDLPDEDLLTHLVEAIDFIDAAVSRGGAVLVHCFRGRSRSATVVIAYLMHKHHYKLEKAFFKVKSKRECINPHIGFLAQLKLFEAMEYTLDHSNVQYKMFRLYCASERMRKAKILFRDSLDKVLDNDPAGGLPGSAEAAAAAASKSRYPMIYKCRKCRRTLASAFNMLPHVRGETPNWMDEKWARLTEEDVIDDASSPAGLDLCSQSVFITPVGWMENEIKHNLSGRLYCPNCQTRVGNYSWVMGDLCRGCGANVLPAFQLDVTEIIFRTHNRYLQSSYMARGPILV